jgi:hypothetical protein
MDPEMIGAEIDGLVWRYALADGAKYLLLTKRNDPESDCLVKFAKDANLSIKIVDVTDSDSSELLDDFLIQPMDVPCIYDPKEGYAIYTGCPEHDERITLDGRSYDRC